MPTWNTPCCDRMPRRIEAAKHVCPACGCVYFDTATLVRAVFGPGVTVARAQRSFPADLDQLDYDEAIERLCDR